MSMRHSSRLVTTGEALRRVFLPKLQSSSIPSLSATRQPIRNSPQCLHYPLPLPYQIQRRQYASFRSTGGYVVQDYSPIDSKKVRVRPDRPPRDEEIQAHRIFLVNPETGKLSEPVSLIDALDSRLKDEKGRPAQFIGEVAPASQDLDRPYPVCKMFDKKDKREAESAQKKAKKETKKQTKQLEISWTISDNDLSHRLARLKEFLEKGWKVELVFGAERKGWMGRRKATPEEIERVVERIESAVAEVEGAKEWRPMQGVVGGKAVMTYDGKVKK